MRVCVWVCLFMCMCVCMYLCVCVCVCVTVSAFFFGAVGLVSVKPSSQYLRSAWCPSTLLAAMLVRLSAVAPERECENKLNAKIVINSMDTMWTVMRPLSYPGCRHCQNLRQMKVQRDACCRTCLQSTRDMHANKTVVVENSQVVLVVFI